MVEGGGLLTNSTAAPHLVVTIVTGTDFFNVCESSDLDPHLLSNFIRDKDDKKVFVKFEEPKNWEG